MTTIDDVINRVVEWQNRDVTIQELTAGLTNSNYKVTVDGKSYVIRIPGQGSDIFIDREVELHNLLSASEVGVGAHVFHAYKSDFVIVAEFLHGTTMSIDEFKGNRDAVVRAVQAIRKINKEGSFISEFIMFPMFDHYMDIVQQHNMKMPANFDEGIFFVNETRKRFMDSMPVLAPCHNDLLAENFIDQGDVMRIIDWEFSGLNDVCFELGDFSIEQGFAEDVDRIIVETYFGYFDEQKFARMNVYKYMADMLWSLYGYIQNHFSELDYDFWEYGMNRFNRAMQAFHGGEFSRWLQIA
jgi:thiamine kinase-like enzyme